jgi:hypothetical protein
MWRRLRWILLVLVVALVAAVVTAVVVEKPTLDDDRQAVDARWKALSESLAPRYATLADAVTQLQATGEADRGVTQELVAALDQWTEALADDSPGAQAEAANQLEGAGQRLRANIFGSPKLAADESLTTTIATYGSATPLDGEVAAYNEAVRTYEDDRTDTVRRVVALLFGFGARPLFSIPS